MSPNVNGVQQSNSNPLALLATVIFSGSIVGTAWQIEGWLAAQRILVDLAMPVGLAWLGSFFFTVRMWFLNQRGSASLFAVLFVAISVLFSPVVNRKLIQQVEAPIPLISALDPTAPTYRAVVVLGGGSGLGRNGQLQLNGDGQRIVMAAQMWHEGKVSAIICTGDDNYVAGETTDDPKSQDIRDRWNPSRQAVDLLISLGVPREQLFRIGGINTTAEMKELVSFLTTPPKNFPAQGPIGLITSAFHIPRAMRLAKHEGLSLDAIPVGYRTSPEEPLTATDLVPNVNAGIQFYTATRECLARVVGR